MIRIESVSAGYGNFEAIANISAEIPSNSMTALLGHNGAGKSTLISALSGVLRRAAGSVVIDDEEFTIDGDRVRPPGLAVVPQERGTFPSLTIGENVRLGLMSAKVKDRAVFNERYELAAEYFPIVKDRRNELARNLSGGQRQMVSIARALASGHKTLLLDEPSVGLAPRLVEQMMDTFARLREDGYTMLLVEQNVAQSLRYADHVLVMKSGSLIHSGPADEFRKMESLWGMF